MVDVQTTFLNAPLKEDVYMTTPEGVNTRGGTTGNCVKLDKALYGLKQASRTWIRELVRGPRWEPRPAPKDETYWRALSLRSPAGGRGGGDVWTGGVER